MGEGQIWSVTKRSQKERPPLVSSDIKEQNNTAMMQKTHATLSVSKRKYECKGREVGTNKKDASYLSHFPFKIFSFFGVVSKDFLLLLHVPMIKL